MVNIKTKVNPKYCEIIYEHIIYVYWLNKIEC